MMTKKKKIYGPWIKWHGGECPVPPDTMVKVLFRDRFAGWTCRAGLYEWDHTGLFSDVVKYCVAIEQADLDAAEQLLRANDYIITPPAKPLTFEGVAPMTEAPQKGTSYWMVQPFDKRGVDSFIWGGDDYDFVVLRHCMAYLEKEHALIAARHLFGLKGGEL